MDEYKQDHPALMRRKTFSAAVAVGVVIWLLPSCSTPEPTCKSAKERYLDLIPPKQSKMLRSLGIAGPCGEFPDLACAVLPFKGQRP